MKVDIKQALLAKGMPYQDIMVIMDLSEKVVNDTKQLVDRVSDSAPDHLKLQVMLVALMRLDMWIRAADNAAREILTGEL